MAAILAGIISFAAKADSQTIYIRMAVSMLVFFILGIYVRNTVFAIKQQIDTKKKEQELEEEHRQKKLREEKMAEAMAAKKNAAKAVHAIDMTAGDADQDGFEPLEFAQAVRTKVKEQ
jgi:predicted Holliday junction resolvase-like endonuclease